MNDFEENDGLGFVRGRSYTWAHQDRRASAPATEKWVALTTDDFEPNDIMRGQSDDSPFESDDIAPMQLKQQTQIVSGKKRRKSYTEIIATAILSSPEKRLTLAEIYDWMAANVEEYKNQRYVPSSSSWKNAVRHNLSVQSCFKRVKRHGVEKPSWWTVDIRQAAKRRLSIPITSDGKVGFDSDIRGPQKRTQAAISEDANMGAKGAGLAFDEYADNGETVEEPDGHAYSRGTFQAAKDDGHSGEIQYSSVVAYDGNNQQIATWDLDTGSTSPISAEQLAQAWLERFKTSGTGLIVGKDGSTVQTLRVKTVHGTEQNVRFVGPLRINVVVRCEKASQTDNDGETGALMKLENGTAANAGYQTCQDFVGLSRTCSIDQTLISLGNESVDVSKILHGDVKMPSTMNVLSPSAVFEEDALAACWNAINGDDLMTLTNMS